MFSCQTSEITSLKACSYYLPKTGSIKVFDGTETDRCQRMISSLLPNTPLNVSQLAAWALLYFEYFVLSKAHPVNTQKINCLINLINATNRTSCQQICSKTWHAEKILWSFLHFRLNISPSSVICQHHLKVKKSKSGKLEGFILV